MNPSIALLPIVIAAAGVHPAAAAQSAAPHAARERFEIAAPATPLGPIGGNSPALDLAKVSVASDGRRIVFTATLKNPPGDVVSDVLDAYIDADDNPATGAKLFRSKLGGFEYVAKLHVCAKYGGGISSCDGVGGDGHASDHFAALGLDRCTGEWVVPTKSIVETDDSPDRKASAKVPIANGLVAGSLDYADMGLRSGQTIRLILRRSGGDAPADHSDYFPPVFLVLK
jgi:hypothetical protein